MKKRSLLITLLSLILTFSVSIGLTTSIAYAEETPVEYSMGDANLDGNVNTRDVVLIKQSIVGLTELTDKQKVFADVYADGQINTRDVVLIQQSIVGMEVDLGVHEHTFENGVCVCGYVEPHTHNYSELKFDVDSHWYECSCGAYETKENHIPGAVATETTDQKCTECNYVITPALGHVHTLHLTKVDAKPQSCTATGNVEYYTCSCGKWFTDNTAITEITDKDIVVIEKEAHKYETLKKTATEHWWECSCGAYETKENHNPGAEATENTDQTCTECGYVITPALGHVHTLHLTKVDAKPQSCTATGNKEYYTCSCGKWFTDNTATTEITDNSSVVIEKDAHKYETLKKTATEHWWECSCGAYETKENHKGGTATCQVKATCSVCDTIYGDFAEHEPKTAWVITDTHHYRECAYGCTVKLNYSEHSFTNYVSNKDATYESDGTKTATCDGGCGKTHTVTDAGSMLIKDEIRFTTLNVNDKNVYGKVSNATTEFVFYEEIFVSGNATYVVDNDKNCTSPIDSKTVDLVVGDNTFYVLETVGNNVKLYTVNIHRREMFTVTFNTNGGTAVDSQIVEEDSFATAPTTSKIGYTFDSWDYNFNSAITGDTTITASWSVNQYIVTFEDMVKKEIEVTFDYNYEGTTTNKVVLEAGQILSYPEVPKRNSHVFIGWYLEKECVNKLDFDKKISNDLVLYAKWQNVSGYKVAYIGEKLNVNISGTSKQYFAFIPLVSQTITVSAGLCTFDTTGYLFDSNLYQLTYGNNKDDYSFSYSYNVTAGNLYYIGVQGYNPYSYSTTITVNGKQKPENLCVVDNILVYEETENILFKYTYDNNFVLPKAERNGYKFEGWYYNGTKIDSGTWNIDENVMLRAKWTPINYDITYVLNGGTNDKNNPTKYNVETSTITLNNPTRDGYTFDGWYLEETFNTEVTQIEQGSHGNITIYAKWTENVNVLNFNGNGNTSGEMQAIELKTGEEKALPTNAFIRIGYTFKGWSKVVNGEVEYLDGVNYTMGTNSEYILYAVWEANLNTLTFNGNGATGGSTSSMQIRTDATVTLNSNGFTKTGYTFIGWAETSNGEVVYNDGANYTMGTDSSNTLYAVWEANLNTLTFNGNGATSGSTSSMQIRTDATVTLNSNGFTKTGYTFIGWAETSNGEVVYNDGANYTMGTDSSNTLYAVWEAIEYGITYELYGGVNDVNNPKTFTIEDLPLQLNCPAKEDEIFTVFYSDSNFSTPITCINEIGDIVLYAEFVKSTFGVKYSVGSDYVSVVDCESNVTHVKVLSYYCGKKVTHIDQGAFRDCSKLEFISLPFTGGSIDATTYAQPFGYIFGYYREATDSTITKYNLTLQYTESKWMESINGYYSVKYYYDIPETIKHIEIREGVVSGYAFRNMSFDELSIGCKVLKVREIKTGTYHNPAVCDINSVYYEGTALDWNNISDSSCNHNNLNYIGEFLSQKTYKFETNDGRDISSVLSSDIIFLPALTRENWHFCGWYDNAEFTGTAYFTTYYSSSNTTLYAKWITEEEYCDGSSFERAINVTSGESITANIDLAGEKIYYKFVPTETKSYTIKSSGGLDTYGYLYDYNGSQLTYNDGSTDFTITRSLTAGKTYYIVVKMCSSSATGTFTVSIT